MKTLINYSKNHNHSNYNTQMAVLASLLSTTHPEGWEDPALNVSHNKPSLPTLYLSLSLYTKDERLNLTNLPILITLNYNDIPQITAKD